MEARSGRFDISQLTFEEKLQLADELWTAIERESERLPLTPAQAEEAERRLREYEANPEDTVSWEEVRSRFLGDD